MPYVAFLTLSHIRTVESDVTYCTKWGRVKDAQRTGLPSTMR